MTATSNDMFEKSALDCLKANTSFSSAFMSNRTVNLTLGAGHCIMNISLLVQTQKWQSPHMLVGISRHLTRLCVPGATAVNLFALTLLSSEIMATLPTLHLDFCPSSSMWRPLRVHLLHW